jgi:L-alanine-DL-glutamate epimerase-like enolase superfamily enzyme
VKITELKTTIVSIPHNEPEFISTGSREGVTEILVELETDEGIVGLGECLARPSARVIEAALQFCKPFLLGRDPRNIEGIVNNLRHVGNLHYFDKVGNVALAGIETALWDAFGKLTGQPLHYLFGGIVRDKIPVMYYLFRFGLDEMVRRAKKAVAEGYNTIYFKVGQSIKSDIEAVEAIRAAVGPDIQVRIDANEGWAPGTAVRFIKQIEKLDLEWIEEPLLIKNLDALAFVRRSVHTPIGANQSAWTIYDIRQILEKEAADVLVIDQYTVGGLLAYKKCAALAEAYGTPLNHHCFGDLGVGFTASLQVIASTPGFLYANQSYLTIHEGDIIKQPLVVRKGCVDVPEGPGLGVELDPEQVGRAAERYRREGEYASREAHSERVTFVPMM